MIKELWKEIAADHKNYEKKQSPQKSKMNEALSIKSSSTMTK